MPPNDRSFIFVKKKNRIEPKDIRAKFEYFNCSGVLDIHIL